MNKDDYFHYETEWSQRAAECFEKELARRRAIKPPVNLPLCWKYRFWDSVTNDGIRVQHADTSYFTSHPLVWISKFRIRGVFKTVARIWRK